MEIRKAVTGGVMIAALSAAGLGLAGTASAGYGHYTPPKPPVVSHQKTVTVTKTSSTSVSNTTGQIGNGNTQQTASGNAGAISNPQVGVAASVPVSVQVPFSTGSAGAGGSTTAGDQTAKKGGEVENKAGSGGNNKLSAHQDVVSVAKANESNNSTKVNNANGNGNFSSVNIGSSN